MATRATATPIASTGPMSLVELSSAAISVSKLAMTVPALAMMLRIPWLGPDMP